MRVLYVGNFLDGTGWAHAACDYALALDAAGVEVVCRNIKLNNKQGSVSYRLKELLEKDPRGANVCVQQVLPTILDYSGDFDLNVSLYFTETEEFEWNYWPNRINAMDLAIVPTEWARTSSQDSGVEIPVEIVPCAIDTDIFMHSYKPLALREQLGEAFVFYTIGEFNKRKNYEALLRAFHSEFHPSENVELVIKTAGADVNYIKQLTTEIKRGLKLYSEPQAYKQEIIINDYWKEEDILRMHDSLDCFIIASHGEGYSLPTQTSLGFGRTPITPRHTCFPAYISEENGYLVDSYKTPVFGALDTIPDLFTSQEVWYDVDVRDLQRKMRKAFEDKEGRERKSLQGSIDILSYGYKEVGQKFKTILEQYL